MKKVLTLCIIHEYPQVLLGKKKRGFGVGRWNGFGGKVQDGESIEEAMYRELREEAGIGLLNIEKRGIIDFEFTGDPTIHECHIFSGSGIQGVPRESEEMKPRWFSTDNLPYQDMWPADIHWLPLFFAGKKFRGKVLFGEGDSLLDVHIEEVREI